jgi:acetylornithine aminotransferase
MVNHSPLTVHHSPLDIMKPFDVYPLFDLEIQRSEGCYVWDQHGRRYLDFYGGHAVISVGHSHPHYLQSVKAQMDRVVFYSNSVLNELRDRLCDKLGELSGYYDYQLFMVNSGAEAIENALKLASFQNGRTKVVAIEKGFHGRTSAAVHITDGKGMTAPINMGFERMFLPMNDLESAHAELSKGDICAVVIEGIQGIGGIYVPEADYLQNLAALCKKYGTVLILDEIQSGYGRSGKFFAHQYAGIQADLVTVAKGMGNGFPMGGVLISPEFKAKHGLLGTTFGGTQLACAAGLAVLEIIENEELIENAAKRGEELKAALSQFAEVKEVRGMGCMIGVEMKFPVAPFRKKLIDEFAVFTGSSTQPNTVRILPPLSLGDAEIECFIDAFDNCLQAHKMDTKNETIPIS